MITDYSSVAFEMGMLEKPVIYYQFDENDFFKEHGIQKGYFDYRKDGFGPVVTAECVLLEELKTLLANDALPQEPYKTRSAETFAFRDQNNCERVYKAIIALDEPGTVKLESSLHNVKSLSLDKKKIENTLIQEPFSIKAEHVNLFRDAATTLEKIDIKKAYELMKLANELKPNGPFIKQKLDIYKSLLGYK